MNENALTLMARRYYRFMPAAILIESRCLRGGYQVGDNVKAFLESVNAANPVVSGVTNFYATISHFGYRLRDFNVDFLIDIDIPMFHDPIGGWSHNPRPRHEWDGEPWEIEVREMCAADNPNREKEYLQYEHQQQNAYLAKAQRFILV